MDAAGLSLTAAAYYADPAAVDDPRRPTVVVDPGARGGRHYVLAADFEWRGDTLRLWAPRGYRYDGASVPRALRVLVDRCELGLLAPLFHDALYQGGGRMAVGWQRPDVQLTRAEVDWLFFAHMQEDGVRPALAGLAYRTVRRFGAPHWRA
jgi:hypothetical protein